MPECPGNYGSQARYGDYNGGSKNHAAMQLPRHLPLPTVFSAILALVLCSTSAWAEKADKKKPMNAEADALRYDDLKQTSVFTGNVVITKGTIIIRGAQVDIRQDNEGFQFGTAVETGGKRAFFRQKRDVPDEWIEGESETILYDGKADTVTFSKNAVLRRYKGSVVNDETTGSQIVYDNVTDVFNVVGGAANASASNPTGRVRAMITPKDPNAAPSAPRPVTPPATLRPSTSVGGDRK
jgi:lipopolysaccharide export system protein LptA